MADAALILSFVTIALLGYWLMGRLDRFLRRKGPERKCR